MSDIYPRFTMGAEMRVAYRVSEKRSRELLEEAWARGDSYLMRMYSRPPRFQIKIDPATTSGQPFVLADASRPAYRGRFATLVLALAAMDDKVREERGRERYSSRHVNAPCTVEPILSEPSA